MGANKIGVKYIIVDEGRLRTDVLTYCHANGLVMSKTCVLNGLNDSIFSNMRTSYARYKIEVDKAYDLTGVTSVGRVQMNYYNELLELFHLTDIYKIPSKREVAKLGAVQKPTAVVDNSDIAEQLKNIELSINRLGNVMMQILEKMPKQTEKPIAILKK